MIRAGTDEDALALVQSRADLTAALVSWDLHDADGVLERPAEAVLTALMARFTRLPVFLVTTAASVDDLPLWVSEANLRLRVAAGGHARASSPAASASPPAGTRRTCCRRFFGSYAGSTTRTSTPGTPPRTPAGWRS
ncbi:Orn/Lys/Arg decarboxylase N-terminal domain-containing protein [Kutzneria kofuensis]|uniref:Orn/Lys/Arg decarboxylase N-terminal domain-containing protein n=1 Tax=Kutzneria kofuensis TaxID=103725 RepID=UPI0031ED82A8